LTRGEHIHSTSIPHVQSPLRNLSAPLRLCVILCSFFRLHFLIAFRELS
jgi:hypothetical protein